MCQCTQKLEILQVFGVDLTSGTVQHSLFQRNPQNLDFGSSRTPALARLEQDLSVLLLQERSTRNAKSGTALEVDEGLLREDLVT